MAKKETKDPTGIVGDENISQEVVSHKDKFLEKLRSEKGEDYAPEDDELWQESGDRWDELKGKYKDQSQVIEKLTELMATDGSLALFINEVVNGTPPPEAIGQIWGDMSDVLPEEDLELYQQGKNKSYDRYKEFKGAKDSISQNVKQYEKDLKAYCEEKGYDESREDELHNAIVDIADNILSGTITKEIIENVDKSMNYESDVQEAAETGMVEGKNKSIEAKLKDEEETAGDGIADLNYASAKGGTKREPKQVQETGRNMMDAFPVGGTGGRLGKDGEPFQM